MIAEYDFLSAFEFKRLVEVVMPKLPSCVEAYVKAVGDDTNHVVLTAHGYNLLETFQDMALLEPGRDYHVNDHPPSDAGWLPFPAHALTEKWRHSWIMRLLKRPVVPVFANSPIPRGKASDLERNTMLLLVHLHPWTLIEDHHTECALLRVR